MTSINPTLLHLQFCSPGAWDIKAKACPCCHWSCLVFLLQPCIQLHYFLCFSFLTFLMDLTVVERLKWRHFPSNLTCIFSPSVISINTLTQTPKNMIELDTDCIFLVVKKFGGTPTWQMSGLPHNDLVNGFQNRIFVLSVFQRDSKTKVQCKWVNRLIIF